MFKSFDSSDKVFGFGQKVELTPIDTLKKVSERDGTESQILQSFLEEWHRVTLQAELVGGGMVADDRVFLKRLVEKTLRKLSEYSIVVSAADLEAFADVE